MFSQPLSKVLEKIVCEQLANHLEDNNLLYEHQCGFRRAHSTYQPILHFCNNVLASLASKQLNLAIFIDLKKAFDTVSIDVLLGKLDHYGIVGRANLWFANYLRNRTQYTLANGIRSNPRTVSIGVPQGSVAGPLLFLILINDLAKATDFGTILFADDTTFQLAGPVQTDLFSLANKNLLRAEDWFAANFLMLNSAKTKYILFSPKNSHTHDLSLKLCGANIERIGSDCKTKFFKFLGVLIDDKLDWNFHIDSIKKKMHSACFALSKTRDILPLKARLAIYNCLIMSHLNYCNVIFGCAKYKYLSSLASLQKKALRHVARAKVNAHCEPIFKEMKLLNLSDQISYFQAIHMYKLYRGILPTSFTNMLSLKQQIGETRVRADVGNFTIPPSPNGFFFPHVNAAKTWNRIPYNIKKIEKENLFKAALKEYYLAKYENECFKTKCYPCGRGIKKPKQTDEQTD